MMKQTFAILVALLLMPGTICVSAEASHEADICIYGGTSGGITAAIQAAREGRTVVLIEPTMFLGGLTTGGLGATDIGNKRAIGGVSREFYAAIFKYYSDESKWTHQTRADYFTHRPHGNATDEGTMWTFEPHVATTVYDQMLKAAGEKVTVVFGERLDLKNGVVKDGARIVKIVMESGREFTGKVFIDATYEGDLSRLDTQSIISSSRTSIRTL
jgi:flavin-dependent dehydrogenase